MILLSARIRDYKCIDDTGTVEFEPDVTCLVGKNESGKTAFLEALCRLNPLVPGLRSSFDELYDYPRRRRAAERERIASARPVTATFRLEPADHEALAAEFGEGVLAAETVTVSRGYDNRLAWQLELDERPAVRHLASAANVPKGLLRGVTSLERLGDKLRRLDERTESQERLLERLEGLDLAARVGDALARRLPRFLYFDDYNILPGRISIPRLRDTPEDRLTGADQTALAFLSLAEIAPREFLESEYEASKAALEGAANRLTDEIFEFWSQGHDLRVEVDADFRPARGREGGQGPLRVDFDGDAAASPPAEKRERPPFLEIRIRNERHRLSLNFGERSSGFVWFFSFLAYFSQFRDGGRSLVLLLDEPGRSLHPHAQRDLLRFVTERLAAHHPVIYATHSPFMIEANALARVRTVEDDGEHGTRLSTDLRAIDPGTLFPLRAALAWELSRELAVAGHNLVVPKASDVVYLEVLSAHLIAKGRAGLDPRWELVPAGGLGRAAMVRALLGDEGGLLVIAGGDPQTVVPADLEPQRIVPLAEIAGRAAADVEDLFEPAFYLSLLRSAGLADVKNRDWPSTGRILAIVEERTDGPVDPYRAAAHFQRDQPTLLKKLDAKTQDRFENLFQRINAALP